MSLVTTKPTFRISMNELREKFIACSQKGAESIGVYNATNVRECNSYSRAAFSSWTGASAADFIRWLNNGYSVSDFPELDTSAMPVRKRKRSRFNDCEGDFRYDLYSSGDENCFVEWTKREVIPGIHVQFFFGFRANVSAATIKNYTEWLLGAFSTLEANGVDCSISAYNRGMRRFARYNGESEFHIDVKREGERNDFTNWSALFAPGSYRILGFFTIALQAESLGMQSQVGGSTGEGWYVRFNEDTRVIEICADSSAYSFPKEQMTNELTAAIAAARK